MTHFSKEDRQRWMGVLARADARHFISLMPPAEVLPAFTELRMPETGMVMVRARIGGSGEPFNLGEMTVTRCTITALDLTGHAMVRGRSHDHARLAALSDALLQDTGWFARLGCAVIEPLAAAEAARANAKREQSDATKVDFFTLVRGEDEAG